MPIEFTQYVLPNGRKIPIQIQLSEELEKKAQEIIDSGHRFECEVLRTGDVSLTIFNLEKQEDVAIKVVPNGPEVPVAVEKLILEYQG